MKELSSSPKNRLLAIYKRDAQAGLDKLAHIIFQESLTTGKGE